MIIQIQLCFSNPAFSSSCKFQDLISLGLGFFEHEEQLKLVGKTCFLQKQTVKHFPRLVREKKSFAGQSEMRQISLTELMK